jgi:hypothetical protein
MSGDAVSPGAVAVSIVSTNTAQNLITITEDRLQLRLQEYQDELAKSRDWITPMGLFLTVCTTLATATFSELWFFSASTIKTLFAAFAVVTGWWTIKSLFKLWQTKPKTLKQFISDLRSEKEH